MSETTKSTRRDHWKGFNFAGTIDWGEWPLEISYFVALY